MQIWVDGAKYAGFWKNNKINGKGKLINTDGDIFEGEFRDDQFHGKGKFV